MLLSITPNSKKGSYDMQKFLTDEEVEEEIERLKNNDFVKLAKAEQRYRYKRRQYMYQLRNYEKNGKKLAAKGITIESFARYDDADEFAES